MHIAVINPNTTAAMTAKIGAAARAVAAAGTTVVASNPADGPVSIEGYVDEAYSVPGLLAEMRRLQQTAPEPQAYVLACFDDTGLDAARCLSGAPVIGIGEAAFHAASLVAHKFGVVTTLERSVGAIEHNLLKYGLASRCTRVRASDVPVLDLEDAASAKGRAARAQIDAAIAQCLRDDGAQAIVLGCAGMADLAASLSQQHGVPVVDGVAAATKLAEALVALGLRTSKLGPYAPPGAKPYLGRFAAEAPR
jgi:allantoin racemase